MLRASTPPTEPRLVGGPCSGGAYHRNAFGCEPRATSSTFEAIKLASHRATGAVIACAGVEANQTYRPDYGIPAANGRPVAIRDR
jgi:hypothetical protein